MGKLNNPKTGMPEKPFIAIKVIAIVNFIALLLTLAFWSLAIIKLKLPASADQIAERTNTATTLGFGLADFIWSVPLLLFGGIGIWRLKPWGWMFSQMVNVLWWYSLTVVIFRDLLVKTVSPGTVVFLPFALFAFWAAFNLWKKRDLFF